jgi:thioredoxin 1
MSQTVTDSSFESDVMKSTQPVLVDFWAEWCGPCRVQGPILDEVSKLVEGKAIIVKCNVDENPESAQKFGIMSIPTLLLFKDGKVVKQFVGVQSKDVLVDELNKLM